MSHSKVTLNGDHLLSPVCFRKKFIISLWLLQILLSPTHFSCWQLLTVFYVFVGFTRLEIQQI